MPGDFHGPVAQLGARSVRIREVEGSNPFRSTKKEGICNSRCLPFWVETAIGFFALQRFSCTAEMNAADAGMLAVAGGLNGVRCPVLGS